MTTHSLPDSWRGRLRWVLAESALVGAIFGFWLVTAIVLTAVLDVLARVIDATPLRELRFVHEVFAHVELVWAAVVPLAAVTATLYVFARAGTIIVDQYRRPTTE